MLKITSTSRCNCDRVEIEVQRKAGGGHSFQSKGDFEKEKIKANSKLLYLLLLHIAKLSNNMTLFQYVNLEIYDVISVLTNKFESKNNF